MDNWNSSEADIWSDIQAAMDMIKNQSYEPVNYPVICKYCGQWYGESSIVTMDGDCGRH